MDAFNSQRIAEELKKLRILKEIELKNKYNISEDEINKAYNKKPSWA